MNARVTGRCVPRIDAGRHNVRLKKIFLRTDQSRRRASSYQYQAASKEMIVMTDDAQLQPAVAAEFLALADAIGALSEGQWDKPSLCNDWRVREVIAHMTMAARYSDDAFMALMRDYNFDFTKLSDEIARRDAELPTDELLANLHSEVMHHWAPPGGGYRGALNHVVIHGLDATVPLGIPRPGPVENIRIILDDLTRGEVHTNFGTDIQGRRLVATDLDWSYGSGEELRGTSENIALAICGRTVPAGRLEGGALQRGDTTPD